MNKKISELGLPAKFDKWRSGQAELVDKISASEKKTFLLDAPVGTGKTLIAIATHQSRIIDRVGKQVLARLTGESAKSFDRRCIFITRTKQLQDQILADFPAAKTMKGRNNFPCMKHADEFPDITAEDCVNPGECDFRETTCPYYIAKRAAAMAPLAVLNTSYYLTEANGPGQFSGSDLLVVDEVDTLEDDLMKHIQLQISTKQLARFGLEPPRDTSVQGWLNWGSSLDLNSRAAQMEFKIDLKPESQWTDVEIKGRRQANRMRAFQQKISSFLAEFDYSWIFNEEEKDDGEIVWTFKPVRIRSYVDYYMWRHADQVLGMSGTILDPEIMADDLGIDSWDYELAPCPFPVENRPIFYKPVVNMTYRTQREQLPILAAEVKNTIDRYPGDKVLVHTTSFAVRDYLLRAIDDYRLMSHNSNNREEALREFKRSDRPMVMLSPSYDRGVDLPNDLCRCVIVCKVPYISMGDPQVKARLNIPGGNKWYRLKACQAIMQMTGRGVRHENDTCDTYIFDKQFGRLRLEMGRYFPDWWLEAIHENR